MQAAWWRRGPMRIEKLRQCAFEVNLGSDR
jgi:hypothetical protein